MRKEIKKAPTIRFRGFTEDWEQRKLGEIVQITMGQSPDGTTYSEEPSKYVLIQGNADLKNGWVVPRIWTTQRTKFADAGDLIMSVRAPAGAMGKTAYDAVIGRGVAAIKGNEFIFQTLSKMDENGYWKKLAAGSTFESINSDAVRNAEIIIPSDKEQEKIGQYFLNLDNLITLHQRKFDELKTAKTYFLQNMFPAKGEKVPRIRFHGFTGDWEQRKLNELSALTSSKRIHAKDYVKTGIPFFRGAEISKLGENDVLNNLLYISELTYNGIKKRFGVPKVNDILITAVGTLGNVFLVNNNKPFYFKDGNLIWLKDIQEDAKYIYTFLKSPIGQKKVLSTAEGSNQKALTMIKLGEVLIPYPNRKEQKMIGKYFSNLDNLITLQQHKIDQLKTLKKFMLQNLFI